MRRREFITLLGGTAAWPLSARAQQPDRIRRVGVLMGLAEDDPETKLRLVAFQQGLEKLGWSEGRDIRLDVRFALPANEQQVQMLVKELIALSPDVVVAQGTAPTAAFRRDSVALSSDGNTAIVGGPVDNSDIGAAWVYTRSNGVWTQQQKLVANDSVGKSALQGWSVALSSDGNTAIAGGINDNSNVGAVGLYPQWDYLDPAAEAGRQQPGWNCPPRLVRCAVLRRQHRHGGWS
jgi:hypothetical protein